MGTHREHMNELYQQHGKTVYLFLYQLCKDEERAKDLTQDTFLKAFKTIDDFHGQCKMTTWLCQIAKNLYFDHWRKEKRRPVVPMPEQEPAAPTRSPEDLLCDADMARQIRSIVHGLPEPYKEVFLLRVYAELPFREIAVLFSRSEVWGRVTFLRAKEMILKTLESTEHG